MTKTDIGIYRGLKEKFDPEVHVGFFITTDTGELLLGDQSLGQTISEWEINNGVLILKLNTGRDIRVTFPEATETVKGLLSAADKAQLNALQTNLDSKVDKVTGKSLLADSEIEKLAGLPNSTELTNSIATAKAAGDNAQSDLNAHKQNKSNPHQVTKTQVGLGNVTNDAQVKRSEMGVANGVATLDADGKVPSAQLPSYVDDIIDVYATYQKSGTGVLSNIVLYSDAAKTKVVTGETGKIYQNITSGEPGYQFRWTGTVFSQTGASSLILGEVAGTAYDGAKGKANATEIAKLKTQVGNLPDEEDITLNAEKHLQLKDRDSSKGMGYKILRLPEDRILTQSMVDEANTIYEIRYNFDLNGTTITVPTGCIFDFQGGSLSNGTIIGNNTIIKAAPTAIFNDVEISGCISNDKYYCEWFGLDVVKCLMTFQRVDFIGEYTFNQAISIKADISPIINFHQGSFVTVTDSFSDSYLFDFKISGYGGNNPKNDSRGVIFRGYGGDINLNQRCGFLYLQKNPDTEKSCASSKLFNLTIKGAGIGDREYVEPEIINSIPSNASSIITTHSSCVINNVEACTDRQTKQPYVGIMLKGADHKISRVTIVTSSIGMVIGGGAMVSECHVWGAPRCAFYVTGNTNFWGCYGDWALIHYYYNHANPQINITDHYCIGSTTEGNPYNSTTFIKCPSQACKGHANLISNNLTNITPFMAYNGTWNPAQLDLKIQKSTRAATELESSRSENYFIIPKGKWVKIATQWADWNAPILFEIGRVKSLSLLGYMTVESYSFFGKSSNQNILFKRKKTVGYGCDDIYIRNNTQYEILIQILDRVHSLDHFVTEIMEDGVVDDYPDIPYIPNGVAEWKIIR